jgi:hypothetical protein
MIKDTCLGCSGAAGPLLQRIALGSSRKLRPPRSLHGQQLNIQKNATKINMVHNTKIFSIMHE